MKKIGDYVIYRKEVCKVVNIKEKHFQNKDYYVLVPIDDESLRIDVPIENKNGWLRELISKDEAENIIKKIPKIDMITCNEKMIEPQYKMLLSEGSHESLIKIIKTTYLRNKDRLDNKKKISDKDNYYFELAEKYLYNEFSVVLGMDYEQTKKYVIDCVRRTSKKEG